ncbi:peptidylprolyl isomerase [Patescibacteria group bacterium]|nr:peptidylprolyl isomerase [Patescibacteria group bacterium]
MKKYIYSIIALIIIFVIIGAVYDLNQEPKVDESITDESITREPMTDEQISYSFPGVLSADQIENKIVRIQTAKGEIVIELFPDTAPKTVSNFVYLANQGYYDGLTFHRREEGFVIQGGDPNGNGTGGPGYKFEDELDDNYQYDRGIVAMANSGTNTNGSQFFVMLDNVPLPKLYSIFGRVIEGMDVVDQIAIGDVMTKVMVEDASIPLPDYSK